MSSPTRVFIVEDHPIMRTGIEAVVRSTYELIGSADEAGVAVELILERRPDLVLLDVHIDGGGGAAVVQGVRPTFPDIKFLVLSVSSSKEDVVQMFNAGIDGYMVKSSEEADLLDAMEHTLAGERPVSREIAGHLLDIDEEIPTGSGIDRLTPKEREITRLIARGYTYREIAASLSRPISVKTLENHIAHIFEKLEVASRHQVAGWAFATGFVNPDSRPEGGQADD
jgi:DNA-binding NarL/FixJ family response regulator